MPLLIHCPTCRNALMVHESQCGSVVACPTCRYPLAVPALAPVTPAAPAQRYERRRGSDFRPLVLAVLVGAVLFASVSVAWLVFGRNAPPKDVAKVEPPKVEPPPPIPKAKGRQDAVPPTPKPPVPKKPEEVFADAMGEAEKLSAAADLAEPEQTRKALTLLTREELITSGAIHLSNGNAITLSSHPAPEVMAANFKRLGLAAWVDRQSRKVALSDPGFKKVARVLWEPRTGAEGLLAMMNVWGTINHFIRPIVVRAIEDKSPSVVLLEEVRNAILDLGGRAWLQR